MRIVSSYLEQWLIDFRIFWNLNFEKLLIKLGCIVVGVFNGDDDACC